MSYLQFHAVFTLPFLAFVSLTQPSFALHDRLRAYASIALICVIAFIYTTPWDNFLVAEGIWYYGEERVLGVIGHVPIEEYAFFIIQTILTGLWSFWLLHRGYFRPPARLDSAVPMPMQARSTATNGRQGLSDAFAHPAGVAVFLASAVFGYVALGVESSRYLGLILIWACPVLALQWAVGGNHLWKRRRLLLAAILVPTVYLCIADAFAIMNGIWTIADGTSLGIGIGPLPIEEAVFFLLTNALVVQGVLLAGRHLGHSELVD